MFVFNYKYMQRIIQRKKKCKLTGDDTFFQDNIVLCQQGVYAI